jgi:predicted DNA-binding WGR domain protein
MDIPTAGWYLENRTGNHSKFYTVLIADNGVCVLNWGRIGTNGQFKIQMLGNHADAKALGLRQVYSKQSGGYALVTDELKFTIEQADLEKACRTDNAAMLTRAFVQAQLEPQYEGEKQSVLAHYDDFVAKAQALLGGAGDRPFDEVWVEFEELEKSWQTIKDKHDEAAVTIDFARQVLSQRLMSGAL